MRHSGKSLVSMMLVFFMIIQCVPIAFASPDEPDGTIDNPYVITTASQLDDVRNYSSMHFVLGADIDLDVAPYNAGEGWEPIEWFNGTLDGRGFEISGLYINRPGEIEVGLFGSFGDNAEISNIKLVNIDVTGNYAVGGLTGWNRGKISHSSTSGKVTGADDVYESDTIGGLVGLNEGEVRNSHASSEVSGYYLVGGLTGDNGGSIEDSYASGNVTGAVQVGGLIGWAFSGATVNNSHASGNVVGEDEVGGLVGRNAGAVSYSYASGEVTGGNHAGGLVGYNSHVVNNSYASGKVTGHDSIGGLVGVHHAGALIQNSYASGLVAGVSQAGGLVGSGAGEVTNSYWDTEASGLEQSAAGEGKTTAQLQQQATFADDWDFFGIWGMGASGSYPYLIWQLNMVGPPPWEGEGGGTENNPFIITSAAHLNDVRNYLNAHFELGGDIVLSSEWEPIGTAANPFTGTMDGKGYKITGLYIHQPDLDDVGLFGVTGHESEIANIRLENIDVTGNVHVGGLVGVHDGTITNVYVSGEVTGSEYVGGLAGANAGNISESYARNTVNGVEYSGGLVGINSGNINDSYAKGDVVASAAYAGGLAGANNGGTILNSFASGYVTGADAVGGLVSEHTGGHVIASYWDHETTSQATSAGSGDEYGKSTVDMQQQATFVGWDFDTIWAIDESESYPYFKSDYEGAGSPWTGSGTEEDPYVIKTAAHLYQVRDHLQAHFQLGAHINLDVLPFNTGEGWEPIMFFNGNFGGMGFTITGLYIDRTSEDIAGLFGYTVAASNISNVSLEEVSVTSATYDLVGGLVGYNNGSISYSSVSGRVEGYSNAGGLVGYNNGNISYSFASGEVTGSDFLGGLAGVNAGNIDQSFASSTVEGVDFLGGLVGVNDGSISNAYAHGDVTASNGYSGGLVGANAGGTISNSYASGKVIGIGYVGGLVSENNGGQVTQSYWDKETSGRTSSAGSTSSYGKTTAEMEQQATFVGWDFDSIWEIEEDERYPYLQWVVTANLSDVALSDGTLSPVFAAETITYKARVRNTVNSVDIVATAASGGAVVEVNGTSAIGGVATAFPLRVGRNTVDVAVTAYDGIQTQTYTIEITRLSGDSSASDQPVTVIIHASVETGAMGAATTVTQTPITRITEPSGEIRDEVTVTPDQARETAHRIAEAGQTTARIMIPDEEDRISQVDVNIRKEAVTEWVNNAVDIELFTEHILLRIPQRSMDAVEEDLYFRIIPLKEQSQAEEVEHRARSEQVVKDAAKDDKVKVVSRPMTIETNMPNQPVTLVLPLRAIQLPSDAAERATFLDELLIFIEHSDGEKRLVKGILVQYKDGLLGIQFEVTKFSTFTILHMEGSAEQFHEAYFRGYEDGTFRPNHTVTRAEIAAMLAANLGLDDSAQAATALFPDVSVSHWAAGAIGYVKLQGLMEGDTTGKFNPDRAISRAEMASIAARYKRLALLAEEESKTAFTDIEHHWAVLEIGATKQAGILNGYEDGTFRPNGYLTRAEAARVINRMFDRGPLYEAGAPTFTDVNESHWAFYEVEEAARDHFFRRSDEDGEHRVR